MLKILKILLKGLQISEIKFPSIVAKDNIFGVQFHPVKKPKGRIAFNKNFKLVMKKD